MDNQETIDHIRKMYGDTPQAAFSLLIEVVESQGREIEALKARPPQIIKYKRGNGPCN
jgi:hypothetical protein